jgi:Lon protease-like protein
MTSRLPIFPLGSVLVPSAVLPLQIFEPRYRALLQDLTGAELGTPLIEPEFGVVLIERGSEVGGGEVRLTVGTVARLLDARQLPDGRWVALAAGTRRFRVVAWQPDQPYPQADVEDLDEPEWHDVDRGALGDAEAAVRRAVGLAARLAGGQPDGFELSANPGLASWQLCALAPIGPIDRQSLLEIAGHGERLRMLARLATESAEVLEFRLAEE